MIDHHAMDICRCSHRLFDRATGVLLVVATGLSLGVAVLPAEIAHARAVAVLEAPADTAAVSTTDAIIGAMRGTATDAEKTADAAIDAARRPRIGLALGGGAARGAAHVGVLKILEQMQIPVDYIAGTSMGAIVGAMYALGMTAAEIEAALLSIDWGDLFSDRPDRKMRSIRRKQDDTWILMPLEFGLKGGKPVLPPGLVAGQKFAFAFDAPGLYTSGHDGFDNLPIPFRAVATDLETGEMVVLDRGNLLRAIRASMAVPGAFPPLEIDGRLLVDGFLVRNLPVDVVRDMGADIVIAVDVGHLPDDTDREQLRTLKGVIGQMSIIQSRENVEPQLAAADVAIQVATRDLTGMEFTELARIIPRGVTGAEQQADALAPYAISRDAYAAHRRHVRNLERPARTVPIVDVIVLDNQTRVDDRVLWHRITQPTGQPLDIPRLEHDLGRIYELGLMESVDFRLERQDDWNVLKITAWEKPYARALLHLGFAYLQNYEGRSRASLNIRINLLEMNQLGGEWRTDLALGARDILWTEWYQPVSFRRTFFLSAFAGLQSVINPVYTDGFRIGEYRYRSSRIGAEAGAALGRYAEVRAGLKWGHDRVDHSSGNTGYPDAEDDYGAFVTRGMLDMFDEHQVPRHGYGGNLQAEFSNFSLGTDVRYDRVLGDFMAATTSGRHTLQLHLEGGSDLGTGMPFYRQFALGGLRHLSGYKDFELWGSAFALTNLGYLHRISGNEFLFSTRWYLAAWFDVGNVWSSPAAATLDDLRYCWAVSLLGDTFIGPVHIGYGRADDGHDAFYLNVGIHLATPMNH